MADNAMPNETICLVCNSDLENSSYINIFCTSLSRNEELLASFVLSVIHPSAFELNSNFICSSCYDLFQMLEQARWTATNIENEIFKIYQSSRNKKKLMIDKSVHTTTNVNQNDFFMKNPQSQEKFDSSNNLNPYVHIQSIGSPKEDCIILKKNLPTIIEDIHISHSQMTETPLTSLTPNSNIIIGNNNERTSTLLTTTLLDEITNHNQEKTKTIRIDIYRCKICSKLFESGNDLNQHILEHKVLHSYKCEECQEQFVSSEDANSHALKFHSKKSKISIDTNESLNTDPIESADYQDCIGLKDNFKIFDDVINNGTHYTIIGSNNIDNDSTVKGNTTTKVNGSIQRKDARTKTARKAKSNDRHPIYSCPTCGKMWKTSSELKSHMKSHSSVRPFMCEKCGRAYKHKHALEIHIGMHNGINPFQCDFCNKCFTQKGALMRHLPIHTGETPYQCEICGKRFVHHTSYNMHTLSHTGKKTHQCPNCDLLLLSTSHLKRHMRVHTGEKPYSCPSCNKRFAERYNLHAHQRIHGPMPINNKLTSGLQQKCYLQKKHCQVQIETTNQWISQRGESTNINQTVDNNWDVFSYPPTS